MTRSTFAFLSPSAAPFSTAIMETPHGALARLEAAAALAIPTALGHLARAAEQGTGDALPVIVVAAPDAPAGLDLIVRMHGATLAQCLSGPLVFPVAPAALVALLGAGAKEEIDRLGATFPASPIFAFAVNGSGVALRAMAMVDDEAAAPDLARAVSASLDGVPGGAYKRLEAAEG